MRDFIIIGSGFGGSVSACRLAQSGASVLVLERGRRWEATDYPIKEAWLFDPDAPEKFNGWLDFRLFGHMNVVQGAGIGGGSLVYANISMEARRDVFDKGWPSEITYAALQPYYKRVKEFMNVQPVPDNQVPERFKLMKRAAEANAWGDRFLPMELCVEFDPQYDLKNWDPNDEAFAYSVKHKNQHGVEVGTCVHCGNCDIGCKYKAKSTLDKNYIPVAEKAGAEFRPLHVVRRIESKGDSYVVHFDRIVDGKLVAGTESATNVIVACGSLGSTEMLLRNRDEYKTLRNVSDFLGHNWTSNGDFLTAAIYKDYKPYPHRGPTITSAIDFGDGKYRDQRFWIQDGGYPNLLVNYLEGFDRTAAKVIAKALENVFDDNVMPWVRPGRRQGQRPPLPRPQVVLAVQEASADGLGHRRKRAALQRHLRHAPRPLEGDRRNGQAGVRVPLEGAEDPRHTASARRLQHGEQREGRRRQSLRPGLRTSRPLRDRRRDHPRADRTQSDAHDRRTGGAGDGAHPEAVA
jgi:choline dehydrogenase-like flavoprotein